MCTVCFFVVVSSGMAFDIRMNILAIATKDSLEISWFFRLPAKSSSIMWVLQKFANLIIIFDSLGLELDGETRVRSASAFSTGMSPVDGSIRCHRSGFPFCQSKSEWPVFGLTMRQMFPPLATFSL